MLVNIAGGRLMYRRVRDSRDLHVPLPQVPGIEGVGRVAALGPGVDGLRVVVGSLLLGRLRGVDIREQGSGNAGGTNALRTQGAEVHTASAAFKTAARVTAASSLVRRIYTYYHVCIFSVKENLGDIIYSPRLFIFVMDLSFAIR